jgi:hypothetical protein
MANVLPLSIQPITNIEQIKNPEAAEQLLNAALNTIEAWRNNKASNMQPIPDDVCRQIFALETFYSPVQLRKFFSLSGRQYRSKREKFFPDDKKAVEANDINVGKSTVKPAPPKLCEVKIKARIKNTLFWVTTCVKIPTEIQYNRHYLIDAL